MNNKDYSVYLTMIILQLACIAGLLGYLCSAVEKLK